MKNKCKISIIFLIAILLLPNIIICAEQEKDSVTAEKLAEEIYINLIEYREIELNSKREKADDYIVKNYLNEAERQIESSDKSIEQAESKLSSFDISNDERSQCHYQIEYLKIYNFELQRNKYYYEMQNRLSELYEEYSNKIVQNQKNKLKYETYKILCEIKICKSQKDYLEGFAKQKKSDLDITGESFEIGYATENDVLSAKAEYESAKSELAGCENNYAALVNRIEKETENKLSDYSLIFSSEKKYESEKYLEQFKKQGFYSEYYLKQSEIYREYFKSLDELVKQMDKEYKQNQSRFSFKDNEDFFDRTYKYISDEKSYYENETEIYKLNSEKYLTELELYVTESCGNLNTLLSRRNAKLAEIRALENSYTIAQGLFKEGRINKFKQTEARVNLQKSKYELLDIEAEILTVKFALDSGVEL